MDDPKSSTNETPECCYVVEGTRKRRPIVRYTAYNDSNMMAVYDGSRKEPIQANGNGEPLSVSGQTQTVTTFRNAVGYLASAAVGSPPNLKHARTVQVFNGNIPVSQNNFVNNMVSYDVPAPTRTSNPMYLLAERYVSSVNPTTCDDIDVLRQALHTANVCVSELLDQNKKLKEEKDIYNTRLQHQLNRQDELHRILLERNLRMKQVVSENVRWGVRYARLKQLFGDEDVKRALGDLAPDALGRR